MVHVMKNLKALSFVLIALLAACAKSDEAGTVQETSADPIETSMSARNSFELIAYIEAFSGGLNLNDNNIGNQFDRKASQIAATGGMTSSSLRATAEMLAQACVTSTVDASRRKLVYGDVNLNRLPGAITAAERRTVVETLMIRATGRKPSAATVAEGVAGFNELLNGIVPNTGSGTVLAAHGICTAILSSAVAGLGY